MKRVICFEEIMSCSLAERCFRFLQFDSFDAVHSDAKARVGAFPVKYDIIQHPGNVINDCADFSFPQIQFGIFNKEEIAGFAIHLLQC